ncbi:MAG: hypothetical protein WC683_08240 [bacterium]
METKLTSEQRRRVEQAIDECQRKMEKELGYSEDLQDKDMLDFYRGHIAKLMGMLK